MKLKRGDKVEYRDLYFAVIDVRDDGVVIAHQFYGEWRMRRIATRLKLIEAGGAVAIADAYIAMAAERDAREAAQGRAWTDELMADPRLEGFFRKG